MKIDDFGIFLWKLNVIFYKKGLRKSNLIYLVVHKCQKIVYKSSIFIVDIKQREFSATYGLLMEFKKNVLQQKKIIKLIKIVIKTCGVIVRSDVGRAWVGECPLTLNI